MSYGLSVVPASSRLKSVKMVDVMMTLMCMYCKAIDISFDKRAEHTLTHNSTLITHN